MTTAGAVAKAGAQAVEQARRAKSRSPNPNAQPYIIATETVAAAGTFKAGWVLARIFLQKL
jgi:hypothetical protein